jgi:hypothetical protein
MTGPVHLLYCREFASQFWAGEVYPRWLMGTHHGFRSPAFYVDAHIVGIGALRLICG